MTSDSKYGNARRMPAEKKAHEFDPPMTREELQQAMRKMQADDRARRVRAIERLNEESRHTNAPLTDEENARVLEEMGEKGYRKPPRNAREAYVRKMLDKEEDKAEIEREMLADQATARIRTLGSRQKRGRSMFDDNYGADDTNVEMSDANAEDDAVNPADSKYHRSETGQPPTQRFRNQSNMEKLVQFKEAEFGGRATFGTSLKRDPANPVKVLQLTDYDRILGEATKKRALSVNKDANLSAGSMASRGGQVKSNGRGQPDTIQSAIAVNSIVSKKTYERRESTNDPIAPLGTPLDMDVVIGDALYVAVNRNVRNPVGRDMPSGHSNFEVTSTVNGLSKSKFTLRFAGQAGADNSPANPHSDDYLSCVASGTGTFIHTGTGTIPTASKVAFSTTPLFIGDLDSGKAKPGLLVEGSPPTRFVPAFYTPSTTCIAVAARQILDALDTAFDTFRKSRQGRPGTATEFTKDLITFLESKRVDYFGDGWGFDINPMELFAKWAMVDMLISSVVQEECARRTAVNAQDELTLHLPVTQYVDTLMTEQTRILGRAFVMLASPPNSQPDVHGTTKLQQDLGVKSADVSARFELYEEIRRHSQLQKVLAQEQQKNYNDEHVIGIAYKGASGTGKKLDIMFGQHRIG